MLEDMTNREPEAPENAPAEPAAEPQPEIPEREEAPLSPTDTEAQLAEPAETEEETQSPETPVQEEQATREPVPVSALETAHVPAQEPETGKKKRAKKAKKPRKTLTRKQELFRFAVRLVCFGIIMVLLLFYARYVFTPKHDYGICAMANLYRQPRDSVDVMILGTSLAYAGVNTNILWDEYGIASYNLCSAESPYWSTYYSLREALRLQRPQLILLDAKASTYTQGYSKHARTILSTFGILSPDNRIGAVIACAKEPKEAQDYALGLAAVHSAYKDIQWENFIFPPDNGGRGVNWKGYIEADEWEMHQRPSLSWVSTQKKMNEKQEEYLRLIIELTIQEDIPLLLVGFPIPDYANDHMFYNTVWAIADEYGIPYVNYNDPNLRFGLRYSTDYCDWQHLNVKGAMNFSRKLAQDLQTWYTLPDRRGDPYYASYDACAEEWKAKIPTFKTYEVQSAGYYGYDWDE